MKQSIALLISLLSILSTYGCATQQDDDVPPPDTGYRAIIGAQDDQDNTNREEQDNTGGQTEGIYDYYDCMVENQCECSSYFLKVNDVWQPRNGRIDEGTTCVESICKEGDIFDYEGCANSDCACRYYQCHDASWVFINDGGNDGPNCMD